MVVKWQSLIQFRIRISRSNGTRKTEYGSSDNWHDVAKAWPDPNRYEYTGKLK